MLDPWMSVAFEIEGVLFIGLCAKKKQPSKTYWRVNLGEKHLLYVLIFS